jgi:nitroimidazol reductase NimA-like FMN-containing flavoprotein (pyridoxamine 5'-phosphate oxidase superfamily)
MSPRRDRNGLVVLDRDACLERLSRRHIATVAITDGALPVALPALYTLHGDAIFLAADPEGILGRRLPNTVVSLCVHDIDDRFTAGWNVTVTGLAERVKESFEPLTVDDLLYAWGDANDLQVVVRLGTDRITGREVWPS